MAFVKVQDFIMEVIEPRDRVKDVASIPLHQFGSNAKIVRIMNASSISQKQFRPDRKACSFACMVNDAKKQKPLPRDCCLRLT
eukprot:2578206-Amphidinium_carterae.1